MSQNSNNDHGALISRLALGGILLSHGLLKALVFTVAGTVGYFESLGLPVIAAYMTIFGEIIGGIAILLGLYTRLASLLSLPIFIGAIWVHSANGWVFSNQGGGWEFPLFLTIMALSVALQGSGSFAVRRPAFLDSYIPKILQK